MQPTSGPLDSPGTEGRRWLLPKQQYEAMARIKIACLWGGDRIPVSHELRMPRIGMICANNHPPPTQKDTINGQLEKTH